MEPGHLRDLDPGARRRLVDRRWTLDEVLPRVEAIVDAVRREGDAALLRFCAEFDGVKPVSLRVPTPLIRAAWRTLPAALQSALRVARNNIEAFHLPQAPRPLEVPLGGDPRMGILGLRPIPLDRVGIYVPGGSAGYPSTVLMASLPARLAGVERMALCTPPMGDGLPAQATLAAADLCGVEEVYAVGGAQAIAALALGTETIAPVAKVVGPGNRYVTAAKHLLRNTVATDALAGPSEVVVVADGGADRSAVAWDLLAQAEHGADALALLLTPCPSLAAEVLGELRRAQGSRCAAPRILLTEDLREALTFAEELAPEHLVLNVKDPRACLDLVPSAAAVFLGPTTPVTLGDYCLGTNHILPTMGFARRASPLTVGDFVRWQTTAEVSPGGMAWVGHHAVVLAEAEGFAAHARAVEARGRRS